MIEYLIVVLVSALLGATMKIADLLDEHGYVWFKHADIVFGLLWGLCGSYLIFQNPLLATIWISVLFCFIVRFRLDYLNHGIAAGMWFIAMAYIAYSLRDNMGAFIYFGSLFTITGLIHDHMQYHAPKVKGLQKFFFLDFKLYWYLIALGYTIYAKNLLPILTIWPFECVYDYFSSNKAIPLLKKIGLRQKGNFCHS